jgi:predicted DNA-binding protein (MmcQ/YjbR family)
MTLDHLIAFCETLPGAIPMIKIEDHLTYNVGGKSFIWIGHDQLPVTCDFKCTQEDFYHWAEREGFIPAPYLARSHWIRCQDISMLSPEEMETCLRKSYELILNTLPKKIRENLG